MCFHVSVTSKAALEARYKRYVEKSGNDFEPLFHANGFDHPNLPVITTADPDKIQMFQWGLIPWFAQNGAQAAELMNKTLNAKAETVFELRSFKDAIPSRRCLVLIDGFYEWMHVKSKTYPHFIRMRDKEPFALGGIWNNWVNKETGEVYNTFSILTTAANPLLARIHNTKLRMPLVLPREAEELWIEPHATRKDIETLMQPLSNDELEAYTITRLVTQRGANSNVPEVTAPCRYPELEKQPGLF